MILNKTFKVNAMTLLIQGRIYRLIWFFATLFIIATVIKFIGFKDCHFMAVFFFIYYVLSYVILLLKVPFSL